MYLADISRLNQGQVLGKSLYDENSKLLLAAGYKISDQIIKLLKKHGFRSVYVSDGLTDEITPEEVISASLRMTSNKLVIETYEEVRNHPSIRKNTALKTLDPEKLKARINDDPKLNHIIRMPEIKNIVENIMDDIISNNISMFAALPIKSDSGKDYEHAVDTTILCILMGRLFDYNWKDLYSLASSALLHDIGKAVIPQVSPKEQEVYYKEHPTYSMLLVQGNDPSGFSKHFTVHHHHEELGGEGYPQGLTAHDISPARRSPTNKSEIFHHAFILSVANYYDNLISGDVDETIYHPSRLFRKSSVKLALAGTVMLCRHWHLL